MLALLLCVCAGGGCLRSNEHRLILATGPVSSGPMIRLIEGTSGWFEVRDVLPVDFEPSRLTPDELSAILAVYVDGGTSGDPGKQPAVLGSYTTEKATLRFRPRFPLREGVRYRAVFAPARLPGAAKTDAVVSYFELPKAEATPTSVVKEIFPSSQQVPENLLRFYIHFPAPMSRGMAYQHIKLLDANGKAVETPFLELDEELWDPKGMRFTLFIDPGRIKRGLKPREDVGPALEEGKSYTLVIDSHWVDAHGNRMKEPHKKSFRVGPPDDQQPDPKTWKLALPTARTPQALTVKFPKPLDHALLERMLWVTDKDGERVDGFVKVSADETAWHFTPEDDWKAGAYEIVIDTALEDLCGNSIARPFEVDVVRPIQTKVEAKTVKLPFQVKE